MKRIDTECLGTWMRRGGKHRRQEDAFRSRCDRRRQFVRVMSSGKEEAISWPGCRSVVAVRAPILITGQDYPVSTLASDRCKLVEPGTPRVGIEVVVAKDESRTTWQTSKRRLNSSVVSPIAQQPQQREDGPIGSGMMLASFHTHAIARRDGKGRHPATASTGEYCQGLHNRPPRTRRCYACCGQQDPSG